MVRRRDDGRAELAARRPRGPAPPPATTRCARPVDGWTSARPSTDGTERARRRRERFLGGAQGVACGWRGGQPCRSRWRRHPSRRTAAAGRSRGGRRRSACRTGRPATTSTLMHVATAADTPESSSDRHERRPQARDTGGIGAQRLAVAVVLAGVEPDLPVRAGRRSGVAGAAAAHVSTASPMRVVAASSMPTMSTARTSRRRRSGRPASGRRPSHRRRRGRPPARARWPARGTGCRRRGCRPRRSPLAGGENGIVDGDHVDRVEPAGRVEHVGGGVGRIVERVLHSTSGVDRLDHRGAERVRRANSEIIAGFTSVRSAVASSPVAASLLVELGRGPLRRAGRSRPP